MNQKRKAYLDQLKSMINTIDFLPQYAQTQPVTNMDLQAALVLIYDILSEDENETEERMF